MSSITQKQANNIVLLHEKLKIVPKEQFNYRSVVNNDIIDNDNPFKCQTTACAWGWCPSIFPKEVKWERCNYSFEVVDATDNERDMYEIGEQLFGMNENDFCMIFMGNDDGTYYSGDGYSNVKKEDVMKALCQFLDTNGYKIV
jgi:hypothetical protein